MNCPHCGAKLRDTAKFCNRCGEKLLQQDKVEYAEKPQISAAGDYVPIQSVSTRRAAPKVPITIGVITAVVVIAAVVLIVILTSAKVNDNFFPQTDQLTVSNQKTEAGDILRIINKDGKIEEKVDASGGFGRMSLDGSASLIYGNDCMYYYRDGRLSQVESKDGGYATMSADGSTILAVLEGFDSEFVYLYPDEKNRLIEAKKINGCIVSPSGKYVCVNVEDDFGNKKNYLINTKTNEQQELEITDGAINVSDSGKTVYYYDNGVYSVWSNGETIPLVGSDYRMVTRQYNADNSQVLYIYNDKTYLYDENSGKTLVSNMGTYSIRPPRTQVYSLAADGFDYNIGIRDFREIYLFSYNEHTLQFLDSDLKVYDVATDVESPMLSSDGKQVVYQNTSGGIYRIDGTSDSGRKIAKTEPEYIGSAETYCVSASGDKVYMLKSNGELYCNSQRIDTNVGKDGFSSWQIFDGEKLIYIKAGQAYVSEGSTPYKIPGLESEYVSSVYGNTFYPSIRVEKNFRSSGMPSVYLYIGSKLIPSDYYE